MGFQQVFKVVDIFLKVPEANVFGAEGRLVSTKGASYLGESGGMPPRTFLK